MTFSLRPSLDHDIYLDELEARLAELQQLATDVERAQALAWARRRLLPVSVFLPQGNPETRH